MFVSFPEFESIEHKLDKILNILDSIFSQEQSIMADLSALTSQVEQNSTVEASAVTLIQGLASQITAAGTDPVAIASLVTQLNTSAAGLAAAIAANTPAAPAAGSPAAQKATASIAAAKTAKS